MDSSGGGSGDVYAAGVLSISSGRGECVTGDGGGRESAVSSNSRMAPLPETCRGWRERGGA